MTPFITTFYSYKGGVGRTVLAANVAILLARRGKTLLWDLDIEAPGLHRIPELTPARQPKDGFFEWLLAWQKSGAEPTAADYATLVKAARPVTVASNLFTLQAHGEKADFAGLYQDIDWSAILATDPARGLAIFRGVLSAFGDKEFRYIVLDSRTGITDIGGLLTAVLPHVTVLVGNYGAQNTGGLEHVWRALGRAAEGRIAVRNPLPPLRRLLVASPIPQDQVELGAQGRLVWKRAFGELPTQVVEVPFDSRLLLSEALLSVRSEESALTKAYRDITAGITAAEDDLLALEAAPFRHVDDTRSGELRERGDRTLKGQSFEDRIAGLLALLGYTVEREQLVGSNQVDLVVRSRVGLIDQLILVECKDHRGEIHKKALEIFQTWIVEARAKQRTTDGMFIAQRFAPAARTYAAAQGIHIFTPAELEARLFDFSPYLRRRCAEFEGSSLFGHYVAQRIASDTPEASDLIAHATSWAQGQGSRLWLLLGDYGTGKSSFIRQFAYTLAKAALDDHALATPVPVFIDLKDVPNAVSIDGLLLEHFRHHLSTEDFARFNPATILYLLDSGRVVLLLDSFDEMGLAQVGRSMDEQFRELAQHARAGVNLRSNRILMTCRTHFFRSQQQVKDVVDGPDDPLLRLDQDDTPLGKVARGLGAHIDELALFEDYQVTEFLRVHVGTQRADEVLAFIKKTYDLPRLARRPVMLDMIMKSADRLASRQDTVTPGLLYSIYTGDWLRDRSSRQLQTTFAQRLAILETLAHALWVAPENRMHYSDLPQLLRRNERLFPGVDAARVDEELRTASFLVRDAAGYYRFAHKSFLEYFFARHLVGCLAVSNDAPAVNPTSSLDYALDAPPITRECAHFMADLLVLARVTDEQTAASNPIPTDAHAPLPLVAALARRAHEVLAGAYRERISENMLLLVHHMGQYSAQQGRQVGSLQTLSAGLQNAIPPGAHLAGAQLADQDLSGIALAHANLRGANLAAALLAGADLRGAVLTGATLTGALLVEVNAAGADLSEIKAGSVDFIGANLEVAKLDRAYLPSADFTGAHLVAASFRDANLWHANLRDVGAGRANFDRADLTAVELIDADCAGASFLATRLHAARLKGCRLAGAQWAPASDAYLTAPRDPQDWLGPEVDLLDPQLSSAAQRLPAHLHAHLALGHDGPVASVAWSADGQRLASGGLDNTVKVWDTQSGACVLSLEGHGNRVASVAWSADGQRLASGSGDRTIKLWDALSGKEIATLVGTPRGWLTVFADQRYRAQPGAEDYLRYVDAREARAMATRIWHAADIAYRMQIDDDEDLGPLMMPTLSGARALPVTQNK